MKISLYVLTIVIGLFMALHLSMNAQVGVVLKNPRMGNALFWVIGAATALIIALTNWDSTIFSKLKEVHPALLLAGVIGGMLVFAIAWLIPKLGAGNFMIIMLSGQIIGGLVLSHFGWLGSPVQPVSLVKVLGVLVMLVGVALATMTKSA